MKLALHLLFLCTMMLASVPLLAQTILNGSIESIFPNKLQLSSGELLARTDTTTIKMPTNKDGKWEDLKNGDKVRVMLDSKKRIVSVTLMDRIQNKTIVQQMVEMEPVEGR